MVAGVTSPAYYLFETGMKMDCPSQTLRLHIAAYTRHFVDTFVRLMVWTLTSSLGIVLTTSAGCQVKHDAESTRRGAVSQPMSDTTSFTVPIRGPGGSTTLIVFAGTGNNEGQLYVWLNRSRANIKTSMDTWYPTSQSLVEALTLGQLKPFDVWAGGSDAATRIASENGVRIRSLTSDEINGLRDAINR